jgi:hypothetical protein
MYNYLCAFEFVLRGIFLCIEVKAVHLALRNKKCPSCSMHVLICSCVVLAVCCSELKAVPLALRNMKCPSCSIHVLVCSCFVFGLLCATPTLISDRKVY